MALTLPSSLQGPSKAPSQLAPKCVVTCDSMVRCGRPESKMDWFPTQSLQFQAFWSGGKSFRKYHSMSMFGFFLPPPQGNRWCEATTAGWTAFQQDECQFCPRISGRPLLKSWMCNAFSGVMGLACDVYPKCDRWLLAPKNYVFFWIQISKSPYFQRNPLAVEVLIGARSSITQVDVRRKRAEKQALKKERDKLILSKELRSWGNN